MHAPGSSGGRENAGAPLCCMARPSGASGLAQIPSAGSLGPAKVNDSSWVGAAATGSATIQRAKAYIASVQIQSDDSHAFRKAEADRDAEKGDGESSV